VVVGHIARWLRDEEAGLSILLVDRGGGAVAATLLAVATLAQVLAEVVQRPRKEVAGMNGTLYVVGSSLMMTVSAVSVSTATASSNPLDIQA
jgi:hypothetical protein